MSHKSKPTNIILGTLLVVSFLSGYYASRTYSSFSGVLCAVCTTACVGMIGWRVIFKKQK